MSDLGTDLASTDELDETREMSGPELVAWDFIWRLKTPRAAGVLAEDAPDYGFDLLERIGAISTPADEASIPEQIRAEARKDERILETDFVATLVRTVEGPVVSWAIRITGKTAEGPFEIVGRAGDGVLELAAILLPGVV